MSRTFESDGSLQIKTLEQRVNKVKDRVFKVFSKAVGVKNMREHEAKLEAAFKEAQDRQSRLRRQITELNAEEDRIRSSLQELELKRERFGGALKVRLSIQIYVSEEFRVPKGRLICLRLIWWQSTVLQCPLTNAMSCYAVRSLRYGSGKGVIRRTSSCVRHEKSGSATAWLAI
jgi:hypothetical protein